MRCFPRIRPAWILLALAMGTGTLAPAKEPYVDGRNIRKGLVIPDEGYCDQPYVIQTHDGAWLCVMTTGQAHEGAKGQHVVAVRSQDHGETWSEPVDIEPLDGPEASWGMPLITPSGRVYVFYSFNGDRLSGRRADMLGWYCYRYSDDGGLNWSERHRLPLRLTEADRRNEWEGRTQIFWGIGKPIVVEDDVIFGFTKIAQYMLDESEGWFFKSSNILHEPDPQKLNWSLLPEGEKGLRSPEHGSIQSEQNLVPLSNGDLYCMYRTTMGYPCHAYSRDGGRTWAQPEAATYTPGGRRFKHPRACPRIWRTEQGRYLFWFHNNAHRDWSPGTRNPCWVAGGVERDGLISWSQPEILLYDPDPMVRISYPDLIEEDARVFITETQKSVARVHEIDRSLLDGLFGQGSVAELSSEGLVCQGTSSALEGKTPDFDSSFALALTFSKEDLESKALFGSLDIHGHGIQVIHKDQALHFTLKVGERHHSWVSDPLSSELQEHHLVVVGDREAGVLLGVLDGILCDGGEERVRGWQRYSEFEEIGAEALKAASHVAPTLGAGVKCWIYSRALRVSEAIAHFTGFRG